MAEPNVESEHLTAREAAETLMVSPKTLIRWADAGRIPCALTPEGHRRFSRAEIGKIARRMAPGG